MCRFCLCVIFFASTLSLWGKHPPYNLKYHIKDVWGYVDSVKADANPLCDASLDYKQNMLAPASTTDTLTSLLDVLHRCVGRGVDDEMVYMELSRVYMAMGRYDEAFGVISPCVKPSHAALWYAAVSMCEGQYLRALYFKKMVDRNWAKENYPDVLEGLDTMCVESVENKDRVVVSGEKENMMVDTSQVVFYDKKYSEVYDIYAAHNYLQAESMIEDIMKDDKLPISRKAKFHLLLSICRGKLYGTGSMIRSMRAVEQLYKDTPQSSFASRVLKVYGK